MSLNPASVRVRDEGIVVTTGGLEKTIRTFVDPGEAARFLAVDIWRDREFWPSRSATDPVFDWDAFGALVESEVNALQASNGWRIAATSGDYTIWGLPGHETCPTGVADVAYQATKGSVPSTDSGYRKLESLLKLKNMYAHDVVAADGEARDVRAVLVGVTGVEWHAFVREESDWIPAVDEGGDPIVSEDADSARAAARQCLGRAQANGPRM